MKVPNLIHRGNLAGRLRNRAWRGLDLQEELDWQSDVCELDVYGIAKYRSTGF